MENRAHDLLPPEVVAQFLAASHRQHLAPGQELFGLGSAPKAMFGMLSGRVQVSIYSADGQQFYAAQLATGQWFGEVPLLDEVARAFHVEALESSEVAVLPASAFWTLVNDDRRVLLAITRLICSRYRTTLSWIEDACLKPFSARLASRLVALATEKDPAGERVQLSQEMLASQLGVARQTVNRQLKLWEQAGLIELRYATVSLLKLKELRRIAMLAP